MGCLKLLVLMLLMNSQVNCDPDDINMGSARNIHSSLKRDVSPCSNFWAYACGNWQRGHFVDNFEIVEDKYAHEMERLLRGMESNELEMAPRLVQQMQNYFAACSRQEHLLPKMENYLQELPRDVVTTLSSEINYKWELVTAKLRKFGLNGVYFTELADVAFNDSLVYVAQIRMPPQQAYFQSKFKILDHMLEFGLFQSISRAEHRIAEDLYGLDLQLNNLSAKHRSAEPVVFAWSLNDLKIQIPQIDWQTYFNELLGTDEAPSNLRVEVSDVEYLRELGALLTRYSNAHMLKVYLLMRLCRFVSEASPPDLAPATCVHHMLALLPLGMNYIYDRYVYKTREQDTRLLADIFEALRTTFRNYLQFNRLELTRTHLTYVRAKLDAMQLKLGNLPAETEPAFYDNYYGSASFTDSTFYHNYWQALRLRTFLQHQPLLQQDTKMQLNRYYVNDDVFKARSAPYFEHERNTLTIPLIFLQLPFFDQQQHPIFQQSLIGFILAHEINHAFEQEGILYNALGNETPMGLEIREQRSFKSALECAQQSPTSSLKERLADINGLQLAYDAFFGIGSLSEQYEYRPYAFENEFLAPQLFYLNFAQFFCGKLPPAIAHDADDVRVNVAVDNMRQFVRDFNCTSSEQPQPPKCEMWRPR